VFADDHDLALVTIADLIAYRRRFEKQVERGRGADPDAHGGFVAYGYDNVRTASSTSRWSTVTSATGRTCWFGCTRSA